MPPLGTTAAVHLPRDNQPQSQLWEYTIQPWPPRWLLARPVHMQAPPGPHGYPAAFPPHSPMLPAEFSGHLAPVPQGSPPEAARHNRESPDAMDLDSPRSQEAMHQQQHVPPHAAWTQQTGHSTVPAPAPRPHHGVRVQEHSRGRPNTVQSSHSGAQPGRVVPWPPVFANGQRGRRGHERKPGSISPTQVCPLHDPVNKHAIMSKSAVIGSRPGFNRTAPLPLCVAGVTPRGAQLMRSMLCLHMQKLR